MCETLNQASAGGRGRGGRGSGGGGAAARVGARGQRGVREGGGGGGGILAAILFARTRHRFGLASTRDEPRGHHSQQSKRTGVAALCVCWK